MRRRGGRARLVQTERGEEMNSKWDPDGPSDEASGPVCIQQIHHMNTRLYTGLVAQRCAQGGRRGRKRGDGGEVPVFPNINTDGNHLCPTLSYSRAATLPRAGPRDANDAGVGVPSLGGNPGLQREAAAAAFETAPFNV